MLSKFRKHSDKQQKLLNGVQKQKDQLYEEKLNRISQIPSFSQDNHVQKNI